MAEPPPNHRPVPPGHWRHPALQRAREVISGNTNNILGNPLAAVAWLCNRLADYGVEFEPGQVILPGSCLQAVPMNQVGHWSAPSRGWGTIEFDVSCQTNNHPAGPPSPGAAVT